MKNEERDVILCPKCKVEMFLIEQKNGPGVAKCFKCMWAISIDHWMISQFVIGKSTKGEIEDEWDY